jgi:hypothetical protein
MLTFTVAMAMANASHAETIEQYLQTLRGEHVSGIDDITVLLAGDRSVENRCGHPQGSGRPVTPDAYSACVEAKSARLWAQRLRGLFGDPGRH